ncbi:pectin lyase-like protein [Lentinula edodes]|uniref:Pectin lyase-like protein n=1 Tax=Lentinula edodes TaxID=5353 RepID=A0A1Q3DXI9_LENED|nr:pectin lyase-like protein [Lentinula edodes]
MRCGFDTVHLFKSSANFIDIFPSSPNIHPAILLLLRITTTSLLSLLLLSRLTQAIIDAFERCGRNSASSSKSRGRVVFTNTTYTVATVMNTTNLSNLDIDLQGTLSWDNSNLTYWLNNSLPVGYQNQTSAWLFGGEDIRWDGHGHGTLNGNGQVWYDFNNGTSNLIGRPHQITITGTKDSVFEGIRFIQSQMWTMTVIHSENILLENIYVNNTDTEHGPGFNYSLIVNTDGADTVYANNITFRGWTVENGDDSIAMKANSTNILIENCNFYTGLGVAIGSIGQYDGAFETIQNVTARNISITNMPFGAYVKTWTGISTGYPPNGGGGGLGFISNITFTDFTLHNATGIFLITQLWWILLDLIARVHRGRKVTGVENDSEVCTHAPTLHNPWGNMVCEDREDLETARTALD